MKSILNSLMKEYNVQPVGDFDDAERCIIDCIITERICDFIDKLSANNIKVYCITWWCFCTSDSKKIYGCPHGMGGPKSKYYDGWFSEICVNNRYIDISDNDMAKWYILEGVKSEVYYSPCLVPGLWLKY